MNDRGIPERRIAFLETCFGIFCENGLENTSLKMLAESCGVTNGNLLYYFGSKDNIVIESTAHCHGKTPRNEIPLYVSGIRKPKVPGIRQGVFQRGEYPLPQICRTAFRQAGDAH